MNAISRLLMLATAVALALPAVGCTKPPKKYSGNCGSYSYTAVVNGYTTLQGSGMWLQGQSATLQSEVNAGSNLTFRDKQGKTYSIPISSGARDALENKQPCDAVNEIFAWMQAHAATTPPPTTDITGTNPAPGSGTLTDPGTAGWGANAGIASSNPATGGSTGYVLYPGSFSNVHIASNSVTLARPAGSDTAQPAVFVFHGSSSSDAFSLDGCNVTLPAGQTVLYFDGTVTFSNKTTFSAPANNADARNLLMLGTSTCTKLTIDGCTTPLMAGIYAPAAAVKLQGSKVTGAVVGKTVSCLSGSQVTYDPLLKGLVFEGIGVAAARWSNESRP